MLKQKLIGHMNLQKKITLLLVLSIFIPLTLFGYLFYQSSNQFAQERTNKETNQLLHLVNQNVDRLLNEYEAQLNSIYENESVILQLSQINRQAVGAEAQLSADSINRYLRNFLRGKDDIDSIYLFSGEKLFFADFKGSQYYEEQFREHPEWQQTVQEAGGKAVWMPTYELPVNRYTYEPSHYFSIGMQVKNVADVMQTLGSIYINVKITALDRLANQVKVSPEGTLLIADGEGHVIWHPNAEAYKETLKDIPFYEDLLARRKPFSTIRMNGQLYQMSYIQSAYNDWYYVSLIPNADLKEQSKELRQFLIVTIFAFGASFIVLALWVSRFITKPIRQMAVAMKQVHKENVEFQLPVASEDEIGLLNAAFNSMGRRINDLIHEVRVVSEKEKEAEVRALQAQINPHFVYNSLDTINWMAIERDQHDISSMIAALSDIMRYAIRPGEPLIALEEELKWAQNYAYLQKMRFEDRFDILFKVDEALLRHKVPRLFLQPYLENSILHGMEHIEEGGLITVTVLKDKHTGGIRVELADNGGGIKEDELHSIMLRRTHGIGIYNLDDRLKLEYGPDYGVNIRSEWGEGTVVTIILPPYSNEDACSEQ
ncbi:cache domain-containing sensor histidine kinase [Paenibacillus harenae]|uniref:cache domain-containing sensor histidine kinase n=1 Tax=Paenibacillus harenae TaxID=306543 RepID=UPI0027938C7F|nr:sensor histidine kinase [Paenibacillus harenae]MDQ0059489.1 sensor histidine kinase YesM [Paenibacillus harenae]